MSERNEVILRMYRDEGRSQAEIAAEFGVTESRVCQILGKMGYQGRDRARERIEARNQERQEAARAKAEAFEERDAEIARLWIAKISTIEIGERLGMDPSVVGRRAKRMGLEQRRRGGWGSSREFSTRKRVTESRQAKREIAAAIKVSAKSCRCGNEPSVQCGWCSQRLCEDCARMTPRGIRCEGCMAA